MVNFVSDKGREQIAEILESINAEAGHAFDHPRSLDAALDAIESIIRFDIPNEKVELSIPAPIHFKRVQEV